MTYRAKPRTIEEKLADIQGQLDGARLRALPPAAQAGEENDEVTPPPSVTGSRASGAALASLLTVLAAEGVIVDESTA